MTQRAAPPNRWSVVRRQVAGTLGRVRDALSSGGSRLWLGAALAIAAVLVAAVTVNAMVTPATRAGSPTSTVAPLPAAPTTPTPSASGTPGASASPEPSAEEPDVKASGKFATASLEVPAVSTSGEQRSYSVRVETSTKLKANSVGKQVAGVLNDPRSWAGSGGIRFGLIANAKKANFSITIAAPGTASKACKIDGSGTCTDGNAVVIDAAAWLMTPESYSGNTGEWHSYLINHGVGHLLGETEAKCPKKAKPAPVMMPQLGDLDGCLPNPWPYP